MGINWSRVLVRGTGTAITGAIGLVIALIPVFIVWVTLSEIVWLLTFGAEDLWQDSKGSPPGWALVACPIIAAAVISVAALGRRTLPRHKRQIVAGLVCVAAVVTGSLSAALGQEPPVDEDARHESAPMTWHPTHPPVHPVLRDRRPRHGRRRHRLQWHATRGLPEGRCR